MATGVENDKYIIMYGAELDVCESLRDVETLFACGLHSAVNDPVDRHDGQPAAVLPPLAEWDLATQTAQVAADV